MKLIFRKSARGFTVVELLIVIVVIAIIAVIASVGYNGVTQDARDKSLLSDMDSVESELARYAYRNNGVYNDALNWTSSAGVNANIQFTPSPGNIIVVTIPSGSSYCIKAYNPASNAKTLQTAKTKGDCGTRWKYIAVNRQHSCAISTLNQVYCWGANSSGQLGNATTTASNTPVPVSQGEIPAGVVLEDVATGVVGRTCGVASNGNAYCWGDGVKKGAYGGYVNSSSPVAITRGAIPSTATIKQISPGGNHACVLTSSGAVYCKGFYLSDSSGGSYGDDFAAIPQGAIPVGTKVVQIADAWEHTCALTEAGKVYCWGGNNYGQIGDGTTDTRVTPTEVLQGSIPAGQSILKLVSGGSGTSCVIVSDGKSYCWGYVNGVRYQAPVVVPQGVMPPGSTTQSIGVYTINACQVASGRAYCWYGNAYGELGNGTTTASTSPVLVSGGDLPDTEVLQSVAVGENYACAITTANYAYCWGKNTSSQLGIGTSANATRPTRLKDPN